MMNFAVFASGTGTNFEAIHEAIEQKELPGKISLVVVDKLQAPVIAKAKQRGIDVFCFDPKSYPSKSAYEKEIIKSCKEHGVSFLVLAGYMRLLADDLLSAYPNKIVNIHPSLLPAFKGKDAINQAISYGVKVMGVTIHYVNAEMDGGKIIAQRSFDVTDDLSPEDIESKIHAIEHELYPETLKKLWEEIR